MICCRAEELKNKDDCRDFDDPLLLSETYSGSKAEWATNKMLAQIRQTMKDELLVVMVSREDTEKRLANLEELLRQIIQREDQRFMMFQQPASKNRANRLSEEAAKNAADGWSLKLSNASCGSPPQPPPTFDMSDQQADDSCDINEDSEEDGPVIWDHGTLRGKSDRTLAMKEEQSIATNTFERSYSELPLFQQFVQSTSFDVIFGGLIVLNALAIGAEIEYKTSHVETHVVFKGVSFAFAILFSIELLLRMAATSCRRYLCGRGCLWNLFDFVMVAISIVEVVDTIAGSSAGQGGMTTFLRLIRMLRLMRIVRVLRFIPQLRMIIFMIYESIKSLGWLLCVVAAILYVFSIIFTMGATEYLGVPGAANYKPNLRYSTEVQKYYGTLVRSVYTCFRAITSGQSWGEVMDPLVDVNTFYVVVFVVYISFSVLALLNIITGVFVDGALAKSQNDRDLVVQKELEFKKACIQNLTVLFQESDTDNSGTISMKEFKHHMKNEKFEAYLSHLNIDTSDIKELFNHLDTDKTGTISVDEFTKNLMHLMRGQSVEQYVQKIMRENHALQGHLTRFMKFVEQEFVYLNKKITGRSRSGERQSATTNINAPQSAMMNDNDQSSTMMNSRSDSNISKVTKSSV